MAPPPQKAPPPPSVVAAANHSQSSPHALPLKGISSSYLTGYASFLSMHSYQNLLHTINYMA